MIYLQKYRMLLIPFILLQISNLEANKTSLINFNNLTFIENQIFTIRKDDSDLTIKEQNESIDKNDDLLAAWKDFIEIQVYLLVNLIIRILYNKHNHS